MAYYPPQVQPRRKSRAPLIVITVAVSLLALCGGVAFIALAVSPVGSSTPDAGAPKPAVFDQAAFDTYWAANASDGVQELVKSVDWSGSVLTAHTDLQAAAAAVEPATAACAALSGYWVSAGVDFHSVRVVDGADQVLVSRHTQADACTWRR